MSGPNDSDDDASGDPYEGMSDNDRAYMEWLDEKRENEDDALSEENRKAEFERDSKYDEDDPLAD